MQCFKIVIKNTEISLSSKEKLLSKVKKLSKFFAEDAECRIVVSMQCEKMGVEITFPYKGFLIRTEAQDSDMLTAVDQCLSNIDRQIRRNKTKLAKQLRSSDFDHYDLEFGGPSNEPEETEYKIIKKKHIASKPMIVEEAILQMNMLGHDFFIFNDPDTMAAQIVYKRKDGNYALIELDK